MAYGMSFDEQNELSQTLSEKLEVSKDRIDEALNQITGEKVRKVARNEKMTYN